MSRCLYACIALFACAPMIASADDIPLADFARHAQFRDIKISPEGDYLAASAVVDGKAVLSLIRLADMKGVNLRPREDDEISTSMTGYVTPSSCSAGRVRLMDVTW